MKLALHKALIYRNDDDHEDDDDHDDDDDDPFQKWFLFAFVCLTAV